MAVPDPGATDPGTTEPSTILSLQHLMIFAAPSQRPLP
jgi:hypothetical protein